MKNLKKIVPYIVIILTVILIRTFLFSPARVNGDSMLPTFKDGEIVLVNKISQKLQGIKRFDKVVLDVEGDRLIKRVIGLPGEKIAYYDNVLYINDKEVDSNIDFEETDDFSYELDSTSYFVLGDNRSVSKDSRIFGPVSIKQMKGKVNFVVFPFNRFGSIE